MIQEKESIFYSLCIGHEFNSCGKNSTFCVFSKLTNPRYASFGDKDLLGKDIVFEMYDCYMGDRFTPVFKKGNNSSFGDNGHISCSNSVIIGNDVRIGRKVFITDNSHGVSNRSLMDMRPNLRPLYSKGSVVIVDCV